MQATKQEAILDIKSKDYENVIFPPKQNHKLRNCIFCGQNIKGGEKYFRHWEYPYLPNIKRWKTCEKCFDKIYKKYSQPLCQKKHRQILKK